jgi:hypothetical protein
LLVAKADQFARESNRMMKIDEPLSLGFLLTRSNTLQEKKKERKIRQLNLIEVSRFDA